MSCSDSGIKGLCESKGLDFSKTARRFLQEISKTDPELVSRALPANVEGFEALILEWE